MGGLFETEGWKLELPETWLSDWDGDVAVFFAPERVGALQISEYRKLEAEVTEEDLREFIEEPLREQVTPFSSAGFSGFQFCYTDDKGFWRNWLLRSGTSMLFVTYNCEITAADLEEQNVLTIVRSISPRT